ncbi:sigma-70 family RNA polymerase sigma factor [Pelotomaculum propionicicum]|uniref:sigma-70 family RNA polymerase sigma factor n=1 Tax=Pelotomaculum propionicicum TaxID=258475 RepID=UPI003B771DEF
MLPLYNTRLLVKRAQKNDLAAFEELLGLYQNKVYTLCVRLAGNHADAQDIAQEAFIKAYRSLGSFRNEADFGTWLHRIAVNVWLNFRRKNSGRQTLFLDEPYPDESGSMHREVASTDGDPLRELEEKEFRGLVRTALDDLTEEHRAVLVLREVEGYSYEEVSRMLDCSLGTVKSRLSRAREMMRRRMVELAKDSGESFSGDRERR